MNRQYVLLSCLMIAGASAAQTARPQSDLFQMDESRSVRVQQGAGSQRDGGDIVFQDDFANGLAGNNGVGPWTVSGAQGNVWKRTTTPPAGFYNTTNPAGSRIESATVSNGYMLYNGDSINCTWNGNTPTALPAASFVNGEASFESPLLNLTATPFVQLEFQQRLRYCCGTSPHFVEVSTDGGTTWGTSFPTAASVTGNTLTATETIKINLSTAIATDPSQVKFRFRHNADNATSHYHWQIDDVKLVELYENDLNLKDTYVSHTGTGQEYARVPASQLNPNMLMGGNVENNGSDAQPNSTLVMDVTGPTNFQVTINGGTIEPIESLAIEESYTLPSGLGDGLYTINSTVHSDFDDQDPSNNSSQRSFELTNSLYALDGFAVPPAEGSSISALGTRSFTGPALTDGMVVATYYPVRESITVYGVEVGLVAPNTPGNFIESTAGGLIAVMLLDSSNVNFYETGNITIPPAPIHLSDMHDVSQMDIDAGVIRLPLMNDNGEMGVEVPPGGYFAGAELYSNGGTNHIIVLDDIGVPQPFDASVFWHATQTPNPRWYSNGNALAVRLILEPFSPSSVKEHTDLIGVNLFPNPTNGAFAVTVAKPGVYTIEVFNALGERVMNTRTLGDRTELDLHGEAAGVYTVRISNGTMSTVKRVVRN